MRPDWLRSSEEHDAELTADDFVLVDATVPLDVAPDSPLPALDRECIEDRAALVREALDCASRAQRRVLHGAGHFDFTESPCAALPTELWDGESGDWDLFAAAVAAAMFLFDGSAAARIAEHETTMTLLDLLRALPADDDDEAPTPYVERDEAPPPERHALAHWHAAPSCAPPLASRPRVPAGSVHRA
jgi:hypothetical protein